MAKKSPETLQPILELYGEEPKLTYLSKSDIVHHSNNVTQANSKYSLLEEKVFVLIFSKISKNDDKLKPVKLSYYDICTALNTDQLNLRTALTRMQKKVIQVGSMTDLKAKWESHSPIISIKDSPDAKAVTIFLNENLRDYFIETNEKYTEFKADITYKLHSSYSIRIYKMIMQWKTRIFDPKTAVFPVKLNYEDLRARFMLRPEQYRESYDFRRNVIDVAIEDINQAMLDFHVRLGKPIKDGHKIVAYVLEVSKGNLKIAGKPLSKKTVEKINEDDAFLETHQDEYFLLLKELASQDQLLPGMPENISGNPYKVKAAHRKIALSRLREKYGS